MKAINPYLYFPGTAKAAFDLYRSAFGGEFQMVATYGSSPHPEQCPAAERDWIMHIALPLPGGGMLMASDVGEKMGGVKAGTQVALCIDASSEAEVDRLVAALSAGGTVTMKAEKTFWGAYFAMCADRFGIQWMLSYSLPDAMQS